MKTLLTSFFIFLVGFAFGQKVDLQVLKKKDSSKFTIEGNIVKVYDNENKRIKFIIKDSLQVIGVFYNFDSSFIITRDKNYFLKVWDAKTGDYSFSFSQQHYDDKMDYEEKETMPLNSRFLRIDNYNLYDLKKKVQVNEKESKFLYLDSNIIVCSNDMGIYSFTDIYDTKTLKRLNHLSLGVNYVVRKNDFYVLILKGHMGHASWYNITTKKIENRLDKYFHDIDTTHSKIFFTTNYYDDFYIHDLATGKLLKTYNGKVLQYNFHKKNYIQNTNDSVDTKYAIVSSVEKSYIINLLTCKPEFVFDGKIDFEVAAPKPFYFRTANYPESAKDSINLFIAGTNDSLYFFDFIKGKTNFVLKGKEFVKYKNANLLLVYDSIITVDNSARYGDNFYVSFRDIATCRIYDFATKKELMNLKLHLQEDVSINPTKKIVCLHKRSGKTEYNFYSLETKKKIFSLTNGNEIISTTTDIDFIAEKIQYKQEAWYKGNTAFRDSVYRIWDVKNKRVLIDLKDGLYELDLLYKKFGKLYIGYITNDTSQEEVTSFYNLIAFDLKTLKKIEPDFVHIGDRIFYNYPNDFIKPFVIGDSVIIFEKDKYNRNSSYANILYNLKTCKPYLPKTDTAYQFSSFSADSNYVSTCFSDSSISVFYVKENKELFSLKLSEKVLSCNYNNDTLVVSCSLFNYVYKVKTKTHINIIDNKLALLRKDTIEKIDTTTFQILKITNNTYESHIKDSILKTDSLALAIKMQQHLNFSNNLFNKTTSKTNNDYIIMNNLLINYKTGWYKNLNLLEGINKYYSSNNYYGWNNYGIDYYFWQNRRLIKTSYSASHGKTSTYEAFNYLRSDDSLIYVSQFDTLKENEEVVWYLSNSLFKPFKEKRTFFIKNENADCNYFQYTDSYDTTIYVLSDSIHCLLHATNNSSIKFINYRANKTVWENTFKNINYPEIKYLSEKRNLLVCCSKDTGIQNNLIFRVYNLTTGKQIRLFKMVNVFRDEQHKLFSNIELRKCNDSVWLLITQNGLEVTNILTGKHYIIPDSKFVEKFECSVDGLVITYYKNNAYYFYDIIARKPLYTYIPIDKDNFIVYDEDGHYDASEDALQYVYYSCGNKVVPASKTNYKSRVVGLVQKIMSSQKYLITAPTKEELNICNLVE